MAEYIGREATIKRIEEAYCADCNSYNGVRCRACGTGDAIDMIEDAPAADVAPVVRCKDCKDWGPGTRGMPICWETYEPMPPDGFCSIGRPRDGGDG